MMLVKNYVDRSAIEGNGLFAGEPIKKGTIIWRFMEGLDVVIDESLLKTAPEPIRSYLERYTYPHHELKGKIILDGDHGRFMNHSDNHNCDYLSSNIEGIALRDIAEGEELTCDYNHFTPGGIESYIGK
jgi:uncharacterized protein